MVGDHPVVRGVECLKITLGFRMKTGNDRPLGGLASKNCRKGEGGGGPWGVDIKAKIGTQSKE